MMFFNSKILQNTLILAIIGLFVLNFKILIFGLNSDFFGVLFSLVLFVFGAKKTNLKIHYPIIILIVLFEFVSYRLHTKSLHFLALTLAVCLVYYSITQKFSFIAFVCILLFSSIFNKFFEHFSSEIKQGLCCAAFVSLKHFMSIDKIEGVSIVIKGAKITVDTACMGLSMFKVGFLIGALILTIEEKRQNKNFTITQIIAFSLFILLLNLISNYFRIIILVLLNFTQENFVHHAIGLLCFIVYQVIPMVFIIKYFKLMEASSIELKPVKLSFISVLIIGVILLTSIEIKKEQKYELLYQLNPKYKLSEGQWVNEEVFKIETPQKLIYIKSPSHKPLVCWTGDGYKILESKEVVIGNHKAWFNLMEKDHKFYNSYWWYECGNTTSTSFIEIMTMKLLYNKSIRLINETSIVK